MAIVVSAPASALSNTLAAITVVSRASTRELNAPTMTTSPPTPKATTIIHYQRRNPSQTRKQVFTAFLTMSQMETVTSQTTTSTVVGPVLPRADTTPSANFRCRVLVLQFTELRGRAYRTSWYDVRRQRSYWEVYIEHLWPHKWRTRLRFIVEYYRMKTAIFKAEIAPSEGVLGAN